MWNHFRIGIIWGTDEGSFWVEGSIRKWDHLDFLQLLFSLDCQCCKHLISSYQCSSVKADLVPELLKYLSLLTAVPRGLVEQTRQNPWSHHNYKTQKKKLLTNAYFSSTCCNEYSAAQTGEHKNTFQTH